MILTIHSTNKFHANNALLKHDVSFKGLAVTVDMFKYRIKRVIRYRSRKLKGDRQLQWPTKKDKRTDKQWSTKHDTEN
jgi:hypothetical protein